MCFKLALPFLPYRIPGKLSSVNDVITAIKDNNFSNILIVTSKTVRSLGLTYDIEQELKKNNLKFSVFEDVISNPTTDVIEKCFNCYADNNCEMMIAIGGGSVIDCAKAVGVMYARPNKELIELKGVLKVKKKLPMLIAVPTTAGTGSETTLATVIVDSKTRHKFAINDFPLIPHFAYLDYKLTLCLPPFVTATTGMDALTHAIEAYIGRTTTKQTRVWALKSCKLIFENLETAFNFGDNKTARENMLNASYFAGLAFTRSYVGYVHALSHALGGKYDVAHGYANAILLPHVLTAYGKSAQKKLCEIAKYCNLCDDHTPVDVGAKIVIDKIYQMNKNLQIGDKIPELKKRDIVILSVTAEKEANPLYPVPKLFDSSQLAKIYEQVLVEE